MSEIKLLNEKELFELIQKAAEKGFLCLAGKETRYIITVEKSRFTIHGEGEIIECYTDKAILLDNYKLLLQEINELTWLEFSIFMPMNLS